MRSTIHVLDFGHFMKASSRAVLVRMNAEVMPSSSLMHSMAADFPTLATIRIALSISDCMGLHMASLMPNASPPPRYIPLAIHNIAQVSVLVGGVDFLALQGHICGQLPAYCHYPALGGIHSHFPSVRPFGYGIQ
ncbi:hypothetical protein AYI69_g31 [Smittium culicis]|uniref:Uncharacterized protein n=1 Tax=Smittium culicis TaxID=133412 RepID=A0A1R1YU52_9FUNG|nr:hypothetical protein AYI69_g31 [Smittium culicis]